MYNLDNRKILSPYEKNDLPHVCKYCQIAQVSLCCSMSFTGGGATRYTCNRKSAAEAEFVCPDCKREVMFVSDGRGGKVARLRFV